MIAMYLSPDVYLAKVDDRSIILDLKKNRYIGLNPAMTKAALSSLDDSPSIDSADAAVERAKSQLLQQGILTQHAPPSPRQRANTARSCRWPTRGNVGASRRWRDAISPLRALAEVELSLRTRSFYETIKWMRQQKAGTNLKPTIATAQNLLDIYADARPWFPIKPVCRLDAMALCLYFWRNGQSADLVFGVRLGVFQAHCWAQQGDIVLNEPFDRILQYSQIMAV